MKSDDVYLDFDQLEQVRDDLRALVGSLTELSTRRHVPVSADSMGSPDVADAVERFRHRWADAGERVVANLRACLDYANLALDQYRSTETTLCAELGNPVVHGVSGAG